jgi:hypothetical protein
VHVDLRVHRSVLLVDGPLVTHQILDEPLAHEARRALAPTQHSDGKTGHLVRLVEQHHPLRAHDLAARAVPRLALGADGQSVRDADQQLVSLVGRSARIEGPGVLECLMFSWSGLIFLE